MSAYWNGAATYYRGIVRALHGRGHAVTFYGPDGRFARDVAGADAVLVGSYVPDGVAVGEWAAETAVA